MECSRAALDYDSGEIDIASYHRSVETVDNKAFGVKERGQQGTVDVYVSRNSNSAPAANQIPQSEAYADNYEIFREAFNKVVWIIC